ncbi:MAG: HAD-IIB family hydrolase [Bacillota bacterium]
MADFKNLYILTDMDGTLIGSDHAISQKNKDAIARFVAMGGTFSVATGRASYGIGKFIGDLSINGCCVVSNGAVLYDSKSDKVLHSGFLDNSVLMPFVGKVIDKIAGLSIQMYTNKGLHVASNTHAIDEYIVRENVAHVLMDLYDMGDLEWNKMLFHSNNPCELAQIEKWTHEEFGDTFETNYSSECYFEIIPKGYTKGDSLKRLREMPQFAGKKFIACGDHLNDVQMLEEADFSVCPTNARDGAKAVCDLIAEVSNDGSLIAWIIEKVESGEISF